MNTLSWFIYFADILPSWSFALTGFSLFGGIFYTALCVYNSTENEEHKYWKHLAWFVIPITLSVMIPSKNTLYAIAASEFGETLIKSETAGKVHQALDAWLDSQIKELKK